ncbi:cytochrome P450 [Gordonia terrae C-6]|uniref:Cytochrome P450 n=2 Tax=Gordonia terrae TaxID=2055 RepID=R7Y6F5_9ACTN|nr:cytochrome P450 [Gordonia terrae C-6]
MGVLSLMTHGRDDGVQDSGGAVTTTPRLVRAGLGDTGRVLLGVLAPVIAEGVVARRKTMVRLGGRLDTHGRAARVLNGLRSRHDADALALTFPRSMVLALRPPAVTATLHGTPEPFTPASKEKVAALSRFQPTGVLISDNPHRQARRELNELALQTSADVHSLHRRCGEIIESEVAELLPTLPEGRLTWDTYVVAHWRTVRRFVFGDAARDDETVTDLLTVLRRDANWGYAFPRRSATYNNFRRRLDHLVAAAPEDSLAAVVRDAVDKPGSLDPIGQIPHWLFAFDAVAVAIHRALALLASHPVTAAAARTEAAVVDSAEPRVLPTLRATVLESLRLWPTTLAILREATRDVPWDGGVVAEGATTIVIGEFFQRDDDAMDFAQRFTPDAWTDGRAQELAGVVPFSDGPGECPGRNVVLMFATAVLAAICRDVDLDDNVLSPRARAGVVDMPHSLDHFDLRIELRAVPGSTREISRPHD